MRIITVFIKSYIYIVIFNIKSTFLYILINLYNSMSYVVFSSEMWNIFRLMPIRLNALKNYLQILLNCCFWFWKSGVGSGLCINHRFPGEPNAAGLWATFWVAGTQMPLILGLLHAIPLCDYQFLRNNMAGM